MSASTVVNAKEIFELIGEDLAAIEREFGRDTVSGVEAITEIGEYLRNGGGKRLRPALLLLSAKLLNYEGRGAVRLGAVVEIIHTATLVHDDIIDEAQTRRGRPAANTQWGNSKWPLSTCRFQKIRPPSCLVLRTILHLRSPGSCDFSQQTIRV